MQEAVSVPMSNDWLSGFSPHHIPSQPLPADNAAYNKSSLGKCKCIVIILSMCVVVKDCYRINHR